MYSMCTYMIENLPEMIWKQQYINDLQHEVPWSFL